MEARSCWALQATIRSPILDEALEELWAKDNTYVSMGSLCSAEIKLEIKMGNNSHHPGEVLWWYGPAGQAGRSSDSGSSEAETREFANGLDVRQEVRGDSRRWGLSHWKGGLANQKTGEDHAGARAGKNRGSVSDMSGLRHLLKQRHPGCVWHEATRWSMQEMGIERGPQAYGI